MTRVLCRVEDIPDRGARGFAAPPGGFVGLFAVRRGDAVFVYINSCPHAGLPLDWAPDRFLNAAGDRIVCANHGAEFAIHDGLCLLGPCVGERLQAVDVELHNGLVLVADDAGL